MKEFRGNRNIEYRTIRWTIVANCNYTCNYCSTLSPITSSQYSINWEDVINYLNRHNLGVVKLYGGEPSLHPKIFEIITSFYSKIGMYTNISKSLNFWKEIIKTNKILDLNCYCIL
jgi:molybdenum cofactor biosynthesis enzyme MoaA